MFTSFPFLYCFGKGEIKKNCKNKTSLNIVLNPTLKPVREFLFLSFSFSTIGRGSSWHHWRLDPHSCPHSHDSPMQKTLLSSLLPLHLVQHLQERERVRHHQLYQVWVLQAQERVRLGQFWRLQDWHSNYLIPIQSGLGFKLGWAGRSTDHDNNNNNSNNSDFKQQ